MKQQQFNAPQVNSFAMNVAFLRITCATVVWTVAMVVMSTIVVIVSRMEITLYHQIKGVLLTIPNNLLHPNLLNHSRRFVQNSIAALTTRVMATQSAVIA